MRVDLPGRLGSTGASPTELGVTSIARISSVCASIPMCSLRHWRRYSAPCFFLPFAFAHHLQAGAIDQQVQPPVRLADTGSEQASSGAGRPVLSGTSRDRPASLSRLSTMPMVWRCQTEQDLDGQAELDRGVREQRRATTLATGQP